MSETDKVDNELMKIVQSKNCDQILKRCEEAEINVKILFLKK